MWTENFYPSEYFNLTGVSHRVAEKKIVLYGSPACAGVPSVRNALERADAVYEYVDIHKVLEARERVREINHGYESVPTLVFPDGSTLTEPTRGELQAKLQSLGYELRSPTWMEWTQLALQHPITRLVGIICLIGGMLSETEWLLFVGVVVLGLGLLIGRLRAR
jgi:mycoredoxin